MTQPEVLVSPDATTLATETAARTYEVLASAIGTRGEAHLVVTGGGILEQVLTALADVPGGFDWGRVHVWWGDERWVPAGTADRNDGPARRLLFDAVAAQLHVMPAEGDFTTPEAGAAAYAAELAAAAPVGALVPAFDVILLGVGPDAHCASLFPGHPGTEVRDASVIAVHDSPKPPPTRLSLTFPTLDAAGQVWFVASGSGKADAVAKALSSDDPVAVPASAPRGRDRTLWLVDQDVVAQVSH